LQIAEQLAQFSPLPAVTTYKIINIAANYAGKVMTPFFGGSNFCTKFDALNDFFKPRPSNHFKA